MIRNDFSENMTNDEVAELPLVHFEGKIVVIDSQEKIGKACEDLLSQPAIGFDTETRPSFKAGVTNKVSLLQLSTPTTCYLFRLCKIPLDRQIIKVLESRQTLKIGAAIRDDIRGLQALRRFRQGGFVDLQSIVAEWGIAEKSVRKMAGVILGTRVSKAQRLSNWESSSLTPAQQLYAATDAWVCLDIFERLNKTDKKPLPPPPPKADANKK